MGNEVIQADYEKLDDIAKRFEQHAVQNQEMVHRVRQQIDNLMSNGWKGKAATDFQVEFNQQVYPALNRAVKALQDARDITLRVGEIVKQAEEEASGKFRGGIQGENASSSQNLGNDTIQYASEGNNNKTLAENQGGGQYDELLKKYTGKSYDPGTTKSPWLPIDPAVTSLEQNRDPKLYEAVINQFGVSSNPRYSANQQGKNETYCNIFAWDVTSAMGAEIPHWVDASGNPVAPGKGYELNANKTVDWLNKYGTQHGWRAVTAEEAQQMANNGLPVVAGWQNPKGIGHIAIVRPGEYSPTEGPNIAQAGGKNFNDGTVKQGFGNREVLYFVHN